MKKSFSILELIFVILLLSILYTFLVPKSSNYKLDEFTNRLLIYLKEVRYQALIDNKYSLNDDLWFKKRWTLKFFRCRSNVGGIYFSIYSDENKTGIPRSEDTLKDALTRKNIYSSNYCQENEYNSKYVLLTKNYDINSINLSCNNTTSLGQLSFGSDGRVYSKLGITSNEEFDYEITNICKLKIISKNGDSREILISPKTGFSKFSKI